MLEFIRELRDLCDKHLAAEKVGASDDVKVKAPKKKSEPKVEEQKAVTLDDVRSALIGHSKRHGKENTFKLLLEFGAKTVSEVSEKDYRNILNKAEL